MALVRLMKRHITRFITSKLCCDLAAGPFEGHAGNVLTLAAGQLVARVECDQLMTEGPVPIISR